MTAASTTPPAGCSRRTPTTCRRELRDLISVRFVFGLTGEAAVSGLRWLGVDPSRENIDMLEQWAARREVVSGPDGDYVPHEPPECLLRDAAGRVGRIQVLDAETELLRAGFESNPTRLAARPPTSRSWPPTGSMPASRRRCRSAPAPGRPADDPITHALAGRLRPQAQPRKHRVTRPPRRLCRREQP